MHCDLSKIILTTDNEDIMKKNYFGEQAGSYIIENAPLIGEYEYYYTNPNILLKVDQFGVNSIQADPPADVAIVKREGSVKLSPWRIYFSEGNRVVHNFDFVSADSHKITFRPTHATYELIFNGLKVTTELMVTKSGCRAIMRTVFENIGITEQSLQVMPYVSPYVNDLMMAPWDKPEWYTKTWVEADTHTLFSTTRFSAKGDVAERRYAHCIMDGGATSLDISAERVFAKTRNFSQITSLNGVSEQENGLYAFQQAYAACYGVTLAAGEKKAYTQVLALTMDVDKIQTEVRDSISYFTNEKISEEIKCLGDFYDSLFEVNKVRTQDEDFNAFVNAFLPLELHWVSKLDRGWPTGMRGVRDASNDFMGFLSYDLKACREILLRLLSCQRSDGWYPRQIPMKDGKFDLRPFMDGGNFVTEFAYHYLAYSRDYQLLEIKLPYYDSGECDSAYTHLIKGMDFYLKEENIGEHGLCKIGGGDWLDTLSGAGLLGKGESLMITCQLVMSLGYIAEITAWTNCVDKISDDKLRAYSIRKEQFKKDINTHCWSDKGFYNAVYTDNGEWIFSDKDPDGECRPYIPTNSYAILADVCEHKEEVVETLKTLKREHGYCLFYPPMGKKTIRLVGKMGTGDLQAGFGENGNPYNHGSHGFFLRALANIGDYNTFYDVLNYMLPQNPAYHAPTSSYAAPYAIINVYQSVPMFNGRAGFSFLTGSVAMLHRAIYHWMAGVEFRFDGIAIKPCIPRQFENMQVEISLANGKRIKISYQGYGNVVESASIGSLKEGVLFITEPQLSDTEEILITLKS